MKFSYTILEKNYMFWGREREGLEGLEELEGLEKLEGLDGELEWFKKEHQ